MPRRIQFVYPKNTHAISLSGRACALNCAHCNKHYLKQMAPLAKPIPKNTQSLLISGGLKKNGQSFILDHEKELARLKKSGSYRLNAHIGFTSPQELDQIAKIVDCVSFDFVSDTAVIQKVYKIDKNQQDYLKLYKLLATKTTVFPHITIGLDAGRIHWEYEAIDILNDLGADRLVLNVFIPTPGTDFADSPKPDLKEVRKVLKHARRVFKNKILILGCMRPAGKYRAELDQIAIEEGIDRLVQPTPQARTLAKKLNLEISEASECCVLDQPTSSTQKPEQSCANTCHSRPCHSRESGNLPATLRLSTASAAQLGLKKLRLSAKTQTIYLMNSGGCQFNCSFCAQAREATSLQDKLSRVSWPEYPLKTVLTALQNQTQNFKRICFQVVNTPDIFQTLPETARALKKAAPHAKLALAIRPHSIKDIDNLFQAGADQIGLSIDAIDPQKFQKIKGGSFQALKKLILLAADKHPGKIAVHLIIGLHETEKQTVELMEKLHQHRVIIALFAFTPVKGAKLEFNHPPDLANYRRIQVARYLVQENLKPKFAYDSQGHLTHFGHPSEKLFQLLKNGRAFQTSGCPDCNRPYYNERAGAKNLYNYPEKIPAADFKRILKKTILAPP